MRHISAKKAKEKDIRTELIGLIAVSTKTLYVARSNSFSRECKNILLTLLLIIDNEIINVSKQFGVFLNRDVVGETTYVIKHPIGDSPMLYIKHMVNTVLYKDCILKEKVTVKWV